MAVLRGLLEIGLRSPTPNSSLPIPEICLGIMLKLPEPRRVLVLSRDIAR